MKKSKIILTALLSVSMLAAMSVTSSAEDIKTEVSRTDTKTQEYSDSDVHLKNFYDFGTWLPNDDAKISADANSSPNPYAYIYYKPYGTGSWTSQGGNGYTSVSANPSGVDYLQGGSYARSRSGSTGIKLLVVD